MSETSLVAVATFPNHIEAEIAQGALQAADVESVISADDAGGQYAGVWLTSVRLMVRTEDERRAKDVLRERPADLPVDE